MQRLADFPQPPPRTDTDLPKWVEAPLYDPHPDLVEAIEVAMFVRQPLLLTGDPGVGKTSAAYWAAWWMGVATRDLVYECIRSDATAARLRYEFDAVAYFRESQAAAVRGRDFDEDRRRFLREGPLWRAFQAAQERPVVLLLDEIDKAPRDLPNDLLREFDEHRFEVPELPEGHAERTIGTINTRTKTGHLKLVVFTSNGERQLPEPFLRRCVHHHIEFDPKHVGAVLAKRAEAERWKLPTAMIDLALKRFLEIRALPNLRHRPGLSELLVWARVLSEVGGGSVEALERGKLADLKHLGTLLKDPNDQRVAKQR